jgi:replicative DNA helicase
VNTDPAAEQRVIGSVILSSGRVLPDLHLTDEDFATPAHAELWTAVHRYLDTGKPLTPDLFAAWLRDRRTTLVPALVECLSAVGVPNEAPWHARNLSLLTARRRIEQAAITLTRLAAAPADWTPEELAERSRAIVDQYTNRSITTGGTARYGDAYLESFERWSKPDTNVLPTGWHDLDGMLAGGLRPGHLTVIGARPAVGKSMLATELARQVASRGSLTLFCSLEMTRPEVTDRITASVTRVPLETLTAGRADPDQLEHLTHHLGRVADWPLHIDARSTITVTGIRGKARDLTREGPLALVIVDYLQLITPADAKAPREQQVASISRGLKLLAKDLDVPVVALAQVGRAGTEGRAQMHHLRESGAIEADADEILLLHRDDTDHELYGQLEVNIVKNRHGRTDTVRLAWLPAAGRIADLG